MRWLLSVTHSAPSSFALCCGLEVGTYQLAGYGGYLMSVIKGPLLYLASPLSMDTQVIPFFVGSLLQALIFHGLLQQSLSEGANDIITWQPPQLSPIQLL